MYSDAVLNLLAFVFIYEIDDWIFNRVTKTHLNPLDGYWNDDLLKLKIDKKEDELGIIVLGFFYCINNNLFYCTFIT